MPGVLRRREDALFNEGRSKPLQSTPDAALDCALGHIEEGCHLAVGSAAEVGEANGFRFVGGESVDRSAAMVEATAFSSALSRVEGPDAPGAPPGGPSRLRRWAAP